MSRIDDKDFAWCKCFYEVRSNYSKGQCLQQLKDYLKSLSGADNAFKQDFINAPETQFTFEYGYLPAYQFQVSADFEWNETNTDKVDIAEKDIFDTYKNGTRLEITTKSKHKQRRTKTTWLVNSGPASCNVLEFIGNENLRFKDVNLPSNLPYGLYSEHQDVMSIDNVHQYVNRNAPEKNFGQGETRSNITYFASVFFVPMVKITFVYENRQYMSIANLHNGALHCSYLVSQAATSEAAQAAKKVLPHSRIRTVLLIVSPIISCIWLFGVKGALGWDILFTVAMVIFEIVALCKELPTSELYWSRYYGKSTTEGNKELDDVITSAWAMEIFWLIGVVIHFFLSI